MEYASCSILKTISVVGSADVRVGLVKVVSLLASMARRRCVRCEVAFTYLIGDGRRLLFDFVKVGGFEIISSDC